MSSKTLEVTLPSMGESVTEGVVGSWRKQVGDEVAAGDTLVEIETDKVDAEVPAPEAGKITQIFVQPGEVVAVGARLAELELGASANGSVAPTTPAQAEAQEEGSPAQAGPQGRSEPVAVLLPSLGESVTEGIVGSFRLQVGDRVTAGQTLVEIETDKVDAEVPSPVQGTVSAILVKEGDTVAVGAPLAEIIPSTAGPQPQKPAQPSPSATPPVPPATAAVTGPLPESSPMARRAAALAGTDLRSIRGSGPGGLVRRDDVTARAGGAPQAPALEEGTRPIAGKAAALVSAMEESLAIPTATSFRTLEVAELSERRRQLNQALSVGGGQVRKVSFTHLIAFALIQAAREMPVFSQSFARLEGQAQLHQSAAVHLGLAIDLERGGGGHALVVPVIRSAQAMDFGTFYAAYEETVARAREGRLAADDLHGATLTLTNPGGVGTMMSVPRLMAGQSAIVAVGGIGNPPGLRALTPSQARSLGVSPVMTLTSTYDHRVVQGIESGQLLRRIDQLLQGEDGFYQRIFTGLGQEWRLAPKPTAELPTSEAAAGTEERMYAVAAGMSLVKAYRTHGHLAARLDPLGTAPAGDPALDPETVRLSEEMMAAVPAWMMRVEVPGATLAEALPHMRSTYCGTIAYEIEHISSHEQRVWLRKQIESGAHRAPLSSERQLGLFRSLAGVDAFERYLRKTYLGQHTFSLEGLDAMVPMLQETLELLAREGTSEVVLGMAHRGRLNVTTHIVGRGLEEIIAEFESGAYLGGASTGDVKYHYGAEGVYRTSSGQEVTVALTHNPSHLEVVNAVVEGRARALQTSPDGEQDRQVAVPVVIHGDAAFTGQGVVTETLNLQDLRGYTVGGTVHLIANNQIGFTTGPDEGRSTRYASDVAKGYDVPIIHVNADDVEACIDAVRLAVSFRSTFHRDVLIDLIGYRRFGHNEGDEPAYTQPLMMSRIRSHPPVVQLYGQELVRRGLLTEEQVAAEQERAYQSMADAHDAVVKDGSRMAEAAQPTDTMGEQRALAAVDTAVSAQELEELDRELAQLPKDFHLNPKLARFFQQRPQAFAKDGKLRWAQAEELALATLIRQGVPVRLTGQDTARGTFSQRHLVLHDTESGATWTPIQRLRGNSASFEVHNSPLSEMAAMGFEYGYAVTRQQALVIWEAQYGDFFNNAQVVVDQFLAAGQAKWDQECRLTLLLPHGYEGSGPEHSSARIERFLELCAEGNMRLAYPSTAAQYFHLLRVQALVESRRPLVIFTPKSGLRLEAAMSSVSELSRGEFLPVIDDGLEEQERSRVRRVLLCSGKIYHELAARRRQLSAPDIALIRMELLYPFPGSELTAVLGRYPAEAELTWVQEEPRNMGAFGYVTRRLLPLLAEGSRLGYAGRPEHAAPSEGSMKAHIVEQERLLEEALHGAPGPGPAGTR